MLTYVFHGTLAGVLLPEPGVRPLWRHTCCELFVARPHGPAYREFNFAPSGDWAGYAFSSYRQGQPVELQDPEIAVRAEDDRLELGCAVAAEPGPLRLGLSAVIEEADGRLSYWALRHAPGKPDFHHREAFALELG